jgi:hypothetical protein
MLRFLSVHTFTPGEFTPERIEEIAALGQSDSVVRGYRSFHSPAEGQIVWILEAPDKEAIYSFCQRVGLPVDAVTQLELEGHVGVIRTVEPQG